MDEDAGRAVVPGRRGYHNTVRILPDVAWSDPPDVGTAPEIDWAAIATLLAERPGCWLRITHPVLGRSWDSAAARTTPRFAPFRPRGSHEGVVMNGYLYLRRRDV